MLRLCQPTWLDDQKPSMTFTESVASCFANYATFSGRASRSEYWWWTLFVVAGSTLAGMVNGWASLVFTLATLLPWLAVTSRRLHDVDKNGWWQLVGVVPIIGWIVMLVWCTRAGQGDNEHGPAISTT
jgi:uncharacterized membrane protein YhaH (DUF805 family)